MAFLEFDGISKRFPGVQALDRVSFTVREGSCHALMGENGAGKSTLGRILAGIHQADAGVLRLDGRPFRPTTPLEARRHGIAMVHQELAFCPNLSVAENLRLGSLPTRFGWVDRSALLRDARQLLAAIDARIDPDRPIAELGTGQEQLVQIAAAVGTGARILVMDEPTSSLSAAESEHLFHLMAELRRRAITLLYVSHRMDEIFRLCDHLTVLRDGRHIVTCPTASTTPDALVHQMIGRPLAANTPVHRNPSTGREVLRVENLSSPGRFANITFQLHAGEVLGFAGLVGAGRSEVANAVFGFDPRATGRVWVHGRPLPLGRPGAALDAGIGLVPEDRKRMGLVLSMNCRENTTLAALAHCTTLGWIRPDREQALATRHTRRLQVKAPSLEAAVAGLSGGNQQKIALAKWLARHCPILIVDEPTRGVDVGAKAEIHQLLGELAAQGIALWLISSELPELLHLSHRILVLREGALVGGFTRDTASEASLLRAMAGVGDPAPGPDTPLNAPAESAGP